MIDWLISWFLDLDYSDPYHNLNNTYCNNCGIDFGHHSGQDCTKIRREI